MFAKADSAVCDWTINSTTTYLRYLYRTVVVEAMKSCVESL